MPILKNPASESLSRGEKWVPTCSGDQEMRPNGILIEYYQEGCDIAHWRAIFKNLPDKRIRYPSEGNLSLFVARVRIEADNFAMP
jgi:hypothetical protein